MKLMGKNYPFPMKKYIVDDEILDILHKKSEKVDMAIIVADTDDNYDLISYF